MWNGVVVEIELDVNGLAGRNGFDQFGLEGMCGKWNQSRLLLLKDLADSARIVRGPRPGERDPIAPFERLAIEAFESRQLTGGKDDAFIDVDAVVEVGEVRKVVHTRPFDWLEERSTLDHLIKTLGLLAALPPTDNPISTSPFPARARGIRMLT